MSRLERFHKLRHLLGGRVAVPFSDLMSKLEVSRATLNRDLRDLRDRMNCPLVYDRDLGGYRLELAKDGQQELPGLWFSADEIHALLTMQHLLSGLDTGGLLAPHIQPLQNRIEKLLGAAEHPAAEVVKRIRIATMGARPFRLEHFQAVASALLSRRRLLIEYHGRGKDETSRREVSPQRLIHYRDNWYLDAFCHKVQDLRRFSVDAIRGTAASADAAHDVDEADLDNVLGKGYGIFAGAEVQWAVLRFSPERSRWVAQEKWHPSQEGRVLEDGGYELRIPYSHAPELLMDILRHGRHVTVLSPPELREAARKEHQEAIRNFEP